MSSLRDLSTISLRDLSMKVHAHLLRHAVPDITEIETTVITNTHPGDNPLHFLEIIPYAPESKEGIEQHYHITRY